MMKVKFRLDKYGRGTTACPHKFTTFVGNRPKRVGSDCLGCKYRKHIDYDAKIVECSYGTAKRKKD